MILAAYHAQKLQTVVAFHKQPMHRCQVGVQLCLEANGECVREEPLGAKLPRINGSTQGQKHIDIT